MRIIVFTDSLGRARPDLSDMKTNYVDIYFSHLRKMIGNDHDLILLTNEGIDTNMGIELSKKGVAFREPDIVIYHFGINDCAPRIFKRGATPWIYTKKWLKKISFNIGAKIIAKYRIQITKWRNFTYINKKDFEININTMQDEVKKYSPKVIFYGVSIVESFDWMNDRSYGHLENVKAYNKILKKIYQTNFIDINTLVENVEERLIHDGVHLSKTAHIKLAEALYHKILPQLN